MKYQLFTRVALNTDLQQHSLRSGDVATVVEYHPGQPGQEPGYSLEVFNAVGDTVAVVTVRDRASQRQRAVVRPAIGGSVALIPSVSMS